MIEPVGPCDLCLSDSFDPKKLPLIRDMGYRTIALNQRINFAEPGKKDKRKGERNANEDFVPEPMPKPQVPGLTILNRITIEFSDLSITHRMGRSENLKKYDLLAVLPATAAAFQHACSSVDADIVSYDPDDSSPFRINRKICGRAAERGVHFELPYSPALKDSHNRRNLIQRARALSAAGSDNLLISSGASNQFQIRAPKDVANLGLILSLTEKQSRNILTVNAKNVLSKADGRRRGKVPMYILEKCNRGKRSPFTEDDLGLPIKKAKLTDRGGGDENKNKVR